MGVSFAHSNLRGNRRALALLDRKEITHLGAVKITRFCSIVAHVCGDPLSRYRYRATRVAADFLRILGFSRCSSGIALHPLPPLKGPVAPVALEWPASERVSRYTSVYTVQLSFAGER